jgi:hypothetical protein
MCSNYLNILNLNGIDNLLWIGLECCVMLCDAHCPTWGASGFALKWLAWILGIPLFTNGVIND